LLVIRRQVVIPVEPERLWEALTEPEQIAGWFGGRLEWNLEEGGMVGFRGDDGTARAGRVESIRPGRHLRFRWWPVEPGPGPASGRDPGEAGAGGHSGELTEVSYLLEPIEGGTRLTIQERQLATPATMEPQACAAPTKTGTAAWWTVWDERLAGAWVGVHSPRIEAVRAPISD
jgi:uncharacterized protein YndB with AHSA1/START domain